MTHLKKLEILYSNEINFSISTFWDSGYTVQLGDNMNGFIDEAGFINTFAEAVDELWKMAKRHYPLIDKAGQ